MPGRRIRSAAQEQQSRGNAPRLVRGVRKTATAKRGNAPRLVRGVKSPQPTGATQRMGSPRLVRGVVGSGSKTKPVAKKEVVKKQPKLGLGVRRTAAEMQAQRAAHGKKIAARTAEQNKQKAAASAAAKKRQPTYTGRNLVRPRNRTNQEFGRSRALPNGNSYRMNRR